MSTSARRAAVAWMRTTYGVSERRACRALGVHRNTMRYQTQRDDAALAAKLNELAAEHVRWGYRPLCDLIRAEGHRVNHKRAYRVYRDEGLVVRRKRRKRAAWARRDPIPLPDAPNERWSMDFMSDQFANGRRFRVFNIIDDFTRESLAMVPDVSLSGHRVVRILEGIVEERGAPKTIVCDNGPEFTSLALDRWATKRNVKLGFIQPGKPTQNAFIESFNAMVRERCLGMHWFESLNDARRRIEKWRYIYNHVRPHGSLGRVPPAEFARAFYEKLEAQAAA